MNFRTLAVVLLFLVPVAGLVGQVGDPITTGGAVGPDGKTEVTCDLPLDQRIKNIGSHIDGSGMCVFSSIEMDARWANLEQLRGWRDWCASKYPGGGYPQKVDKLLASYCQAKGIDVPGYVQYEGRDPSILDLAIKTGRMIGVTYDGHDGVHYRGGIAHMVCLVHLDERQAVVLDNNFIGEKELVWMSRGDFLRRWTGGGSGWCFVFLAAPPSPPPKN